MEKSRTVALTLIQEELKNALKHTTTPTTSLQEDASSSVQPKRILLILDDNFHLRSMRHVVKNFYHPTVSTMIPPIPPIHQILTRTSQANMMSRLAFQSFISPLHYLNV